MLIIERLKQKRGGLIEVWADGQAVATLRQKDADKNMIVPGARIDEEELAQIERLSMLKKAQDRAAWLLSGRDYSKKRLVEKLAEVTGEEAAQEVAHRLEEGGYINDSRNALRWAEHMLFERLYSPARTVRELMLKGIDRDGAQQAVRQLEPDEEELLQKLIEKKYAHRLSDEKEIRRTFAALERMGYGAGMVKRALERTISGVTGDDF